MVLVMYDLGSRYPVVKEVRSTSFENNELILEETWSTFGTPNEILSDNGPPFNGEKLKSHLESFGISHRKVMPDWPRANGAVETFMRNISKIIKTSEITRRPFSKELNSFLRAYRSTPHSSTGATPASLMFNHEINTSRLPSPVLPLNKEYREAQVQDAKSKATMKAYSDRRSKAKYSELKVGDEVLLDVKRGKKLNNKSEARFSPAVYVIADDHSIQWIQTHNKKRGLLQTELARVTKKKEKKQFPDLEGIVM